MTPAQGNPHPLVAENAFSTALESSHESTLGVELVAVPLIEHVHVAVPFESV